MSKGSGRWRWVAAIGVVVVSAAVVLIRVDAGNAGDRPTSASAPMDKVAAGRDTSMPLEPAADGRRNSMPPTGPLPPIDTPFRLALDDLQRRARAGDPDAMCRLAAEHAKCKRIRRMLDVTSEMLDLQQAGLLGASDAAGRAKRLTQTAKHSNELLERSRHCDGVPEIGDRELVHQWRAAARAGSPPALEHYALGGAFPRGRMLSFLPELATYRGEAEPMARRLVETGSNEALVALGLAYMPEGHSVGFTPLLAQVVEPDAIEALALLRLAQANLAETPENKHSARFLAARLARLERSMTPGERDAAMRRLADLESNRRVPPASPDAEPAISGTVEACAAFAAAGPR